MSNRKDRDIHSVITAELYIDSEQLSQAIAAADKSRISSVKHRRDRNVSTGHSESFSKQQPVAEYSA